MVTAAIPESSTPLLELEVWGQPLRLGNLVKQGEVNALSWYTVALGDEVHAFDALAFLQPWLPNPFGSGSVDDDVRKLPALLAARFPDVDAFATWVRAHFYRLA